MSTEAARSTETFFSTRTTCRSCETRALTPVLDLGVQYLPRFVKHPDYGLPRAPLHLVRCATCGLLQLEHTVHPDLLYREFWYRSGVNQSMREALTDVVRSGLEYHPGGGWLDIGANDGFLLSRVPTSFEKYACEPAINFRTDLEEHSDHVLMDYFSPDAYGIERFEVITSVAMFYDLDDPNPFIAGIARLLTSNGIWINQLNDAPTMMKQNAFDSICHEHLCYYDIPTLQMLYERHGLEIVGISFNDVNGGSVRVTAALKGVYPRADLAGIPRVSAPEAEAFASRTKKWKHLFGNLVSRMAHHGETLYCYGASTKGGTLLQYLDMDGCFAGVADRNPKKHGLRMVGSWLPIVDEATFRERRPKFAVVLPWAFKDEFDARETEVRANGTTFIYPLPEISFVV